MRGTNCYRKDFERGPWFEMLAIRKCIESKESKNVDATFERGLYSAWLKIPEYTIGDKRNQEKGLYGVISHVRH